MSDKQDRFDCGDELHMHATPREAIACRMAKDDWWVVVELLDHPPGAPSMLIHQPRIPGSLALDDIEHARALAMDCQELCMTWGGPIVRLGRALVKHGCDPRIAALS